MPSLDDIAALFNQIPQRPSGTCIGCDADTLTQEHHCIPQAKGGSKWRTVWLCPSCHDIVHAQARVAVSAKAETRNKNYYPSLELKRRLEPVVKLAVFGDLIYRDNAELYQNVAIQNISIPVSPEQLRRLHKLKAVRGFNSMEAMLLAIVAQLTGIKSTPKEHGIET